MRRPRGFTLIELMVYLAVVGIVTAAATPILVAAVADRRLGESLADDALALRRAADAIERDLRCATQVRTGDGRLTLRREDADVSWSVEGGVLRRRGPDGEREFARRAASFDVGEDVARGGARGVSYSLTLRPRSEGASRRARISGVVVPRAAEEPR